VIVRRTSATKNRARSICFVSLGDVAVQITPSGSTDSTVPILNHFPRKDRPGATVRS